MVRNGEQAVRENRDLEFDCFLYLYGFQHWLLDYQDGNRMKNLVFMITELDSYYGYAVGRYVFVNGDLDNYLQVLCNTVNDKKVKGTYTLVREVLLC